MITYALFLLIKKLLILSPRNHILLLFVLSLVLLRISRFSKQCSASILCFVKKERLILLFGLPVVVELVIFQTKGWLL